MDIMNFIGRLHPLVVHLPIGFLFLALLVEWIMGKGKSKSHTRIVLFILILGALSSLMAIVCHNCPIGKIFFKEKTISIYAYFNRIAPFGHWALRRIFDPWFRLFATTVKGHCFGEQHKLARSSKSRLHNSLQ